MKHPFDHQPTPDKIPSLIEFEFDSWAEFVEYAQDGVMQGKIDSSDPSQTGGKGFTGTKTFRESLGLARNGWDEGASAVRQISGQIKSVVGSRVIVPDFVPDVQGEAVDVERFLTGEPECMLTFRDTIKHDTGRVIKVVVAMTQSAYIETHAIINRGAATLAVLDALELAGYSTEVELVEYSGVNNAKLLTSIPLKAAGEALDLDRLAFALVHPSTLRRFHFAMCERQDKALRHALCAGTTYGRSLSLPEEYRGDLYVESLSHLYSQYNGMNQVKDAIAWALDTLKAHGVQILDEAEARR